MFSRWKGKILLPTKRAQEEMLQEDVDLYKVQEILREGYDCASGRRDENVYERCIKRKGKVLKAVAVDVDEHYLITHVGSFKVKKRRKRRSKK